MGWSPRSKGRDKDLSSSGLSGVREGWRGCEGKRQGREKGSRPPLGQDQLHSWQGPRKMKV